MPEFLKAWTMSLSGIIVFGSLCDMLLPNDAYKKYIHLSIGIILILALISPFTDGKFEIEASLPAFSEIHDIEVEGQEREAILRVYKNKLCEKIKTDIEGVAGVEFDIRCEISEEEESFGEVEEIRIIAFPFYRTGRAVLIHIIAQVRIHQHRTVGRLHQNAFLPQIIDGHIVHSHHGAAQGIFKILHHFVLLKFF